MLKQLLVFGLALCMFTLVGFKYMGNTSSAAPTKAAPAAIITLSGPGTLMPGSVPVTVEFSFQTTGNIILSAKVFLSTDPCLECLVTGVSGGPINFAGGAWRTVNPVTITCNTGTITVSGVLAQAGVLCL